MDNLQIQPNFVQIETILQLVLAVLLGALLGFEREYKRKEAGFQTYSLVTLGSCLFTIIAYQLYFSFAGSVGIAFDPVVIIFAAATGIGFLGSGVIVHREQRTEGLTTAAGLWAAAAIGVAIGAKLYVLAIVAVVLAILILLLFGAFERRIFK